MISPNRVTGFSPLPRGRPESLRLAGLIALSDPPREDSAKLVAALRDMNVRTVMVTGDSAVTGAAIASKVGIDGAVCPTEELSEDRASMNTAYSLASFPSRSTNW